jgi:HAD superfamily hydrolase (TIGR01509 family)
VTRAAKLALLFDLDGTLLDTDLLHHAAWNEFLARYGRGIDLPYYRANVMGRANDIIVETLFPDGAPESWEQIAEVKEAMFRARLHDLTPTRGLPEVLDWAEARGFPTAVVTNAPRANAQRMLEGLGWGSRFPIVVIGEELARGKPDPLPYLTALERTGATAEHALAFEDSATGVRAAASAGIWTVGLMTALDEAALRAEGARQVAADFTDAALLALLRERAGER